MFKTEKDKEMYKSAYFRRELLMHILDDLPLWKDALCLQIAGNYMALDEVRGKDAEEMTVRKWFLYMSQDTIWCDMLMLTAAASKLGMKLTVLRADNLGQQKFRHSIDMQSDQNDEIEIILLFNGSMHTGHYSVIVRSDGIMNGCNSVKISKGFDADVDDVERSLRGEKDVEWERAWRLATQGEKGGEELVTITRKRLQELQRNEQLLYKMCKASSAALTGKDMEAIDKIVPLQVEKVTTPLPVKRRLIDIFSSGDEMSMDEETEKQKVRKEDVYCTKCNMEFQSTYALKGHICRVHKNIYNYSCALCGKGLSTAESVRNHANTHLDETHKFKCDICLALGTPAVHIFSCQKSLTAHMKKEHTDPQKLPCSYCPKVFKTNSEKKQHELGCEQNPNKVVIECPIKDCKFTSYWPRKVTQHKTKVHGWVNPKVRYPDGPKSQKSPAKPTQSPSKPKTPSPAPKKPKAKPKAKPKGGKGGKR